MRNGILLLAFLVAACGPAPQSEPDFNAWSDTLLASYFDRRPAPAPSDSLTDAAAAIVRDHVVMRLQDSLGSVVGYKAGLTSEAARARFNTEEPVRGVLFESMLKPSGLLVSPAYAARPVYEGDLIVRVASDDINLAESDEELAAALDAVYPFIELPDLLYGEDVSLTGPLLTAANVAARLGVIGDAVPLDSLDPLGHLRGIEIELMEDDSTVATAETSVLMGDPIRVVRWLRDSLAEDDIQLKAGDLLSLGSLTMLMPVRSGHSVRARYTGMADEPVEIQAHFVTSGE